MFTKSRLLAAVLSSMLVACGSSDSPPATNAGGTRLLAQSTANTTETFAGNLSQYTIAATATGFTVTDIVGGTSQNVSAQTRLRFADTGLSLDLNGLPGQAYRMYQAAFNRKPDLGGLGFQINALDAGYTLQQIAQNFIDSPEFSATYGALNTSAFVNLIYTNVLHRSPDDSGLQFYVSHLDGTNSDGIKFTRAQVLQGFSESPENKTLVLPAITNGVAYTLYGTTAPSNPVSEFTGDYSGSYRGDDIGTLTLKLASNGTIVATAHSTTLNTDLTGTGTVAVGGKIIITLTGAGRTSTFTGSVNKTTGLAAGSFVSTGAGGSGVFNAMPPFVNAVTTKEVTVLTNTVVISGNGSAGPVPAVPGSLKAAPAGTNLKLWLYDPRTSTPLATGIFLQNLTANTGFQFVGANSDGSLHLTLTAGSSYQFDTVEPNGSSATFVRQRYQATVNAAGAAAIQDNAAGILGYYAVTLKVAVVAATPQAQQLQDALKTLASEPASTYKQTSACQLMDQVTANRSFSTDLSAGFPKVRTRLPSTGHIRALIVPVDFPNLNGQDNPSVFFTPLANDMRDFYLKQSYGKLAFDFSIVPNWVRLPFSPSKYGFTSTNGSGDFGAYRSDIIAMTDGQIDYSQYDAVYFLVPKEMPMSQMGYGPAITAPTWTSTGYVTNGATGGADMYLVGNGPNSQLKWMAHETGHAFGLYDEDLNHASASLGSWGLMANNWSRNAIEHNGWDRYLQGWLPEAQVACLPKTGLTQSGTTVTLSPLVRQNTATKVMLVPLSGSKMLAIESRKNEGYDHIVASHEGVLVYTVDMTVGQLGGGYRTQRRVGSIDPAFEDAALHAGDAITVDGVTVTVTATGADGDTVKVSVP